MRIVRLVALALIGATAVLVSDVIYDQRTLDARIAACGEAALAGYSTQGLFRVRVTCRGASSSAPFTPTR